jgi:hypothetical protein
MKQSIVILIASLSTLSCKKYLDAKPDKSVAVPSTLQDIQALLDNSFALNTSYPSLCELAADDYYLTYTDWMGLTNENDRLNYIWDPHAEYPNNWSGSYKIVLYANTVLDNLEKIGFTELNRVQWNNYKGQALFHRANIFFHLAQLFCKPWDSNGNNNDPGIPLKLTAAIDEPVVRATVAQTYERVLADLQTALPILQIDNTVKTRPNKAAAYGLMARIYLAMQEYDLAGRYADSCLQLYNLLIDYNSISASASISFAQFNNEVIFHGASPGSSLLNASRCRIDSFLFASYQTNDLRKSVFFKNNNNGSYCFKGSYLGTMNNNFFSGIATDEILLIKAECAARNNDPAAAMNALNTLLSKRWKTGTFVPFTASTADQALTIVLNERRKELIFRGLRWQDLRRLNKDTRFQKTLIRQLNGQLYQLPPADLRYVMLIPAEIIALSGIQQNPR